MTRAAHPSGGLALTWTVVHRPAGEDWTTATLDFDAPVNRAAAMDRAEDSFGENADGTVSAVFTGTWDEAEALAIAGVAEENAYHADEGEKPWD